MERTVDLPTGCHITIEDKPAPAFTPPPPDRHFTEGSFFIAEDKTIC